MALAVPNRRQKQLQSLLRGRGSHGRAWPNAARGSWPSFGAAGSVQGASLRGRVRLGGSEARGRRVASAHEKTGRH